MAPWTWRRVPSLLSSGASPFSSQEPRLSDTALAPTPVRAASSRSVLTITLLVAVGQSGKPVMLKRGPSATIDEWLLAAEYILNEGNPNVVLCERGIRTFESATRNTLDISAVPVVKGMAHLPIIVDPSHSGGHRALVGPLARSAVGVGADGIMVDVHPAPETAGGSP